ncbi:hypothetical protein LJB42_004892 [Komagataella kurtzmanii]|nr:hypothetical protein LJB42_004892 [Komagataella kurtzmanii]
MDKDPGSYNSSIKLVPNPQLMKTPLITLPLKKTKDDTDWKSALDSHIKLAYGANHEFSNEIDTFSAIRSDIHNLKPDVLGRDILYKYYGQLELLGLRIPIKHLNVSFTWYDAFRTSSKVKQHSTAFEKASVLFNLAATFSELGKSTLSEGNFKASYTNFQYSAGILQFIAENFLHAPSGDLDPEVVTTFQKVMIAQAQEIFLLKMFNDDSANVKHSLVAKLAKAASNMYESITEPLKGFLSKGVPITFSQLTAYKAIYYDALAHYHNALHNKATSKYGAAIADLKEAESQLKECENTFLPSDFKQIGDFQSELSELIKIELPSIEKDNEFVFNDHVPSTAPIIKPLEGAKPISLADQDFSATVGKDLFEKIIPMSVHEQSSLYSEMQAQLLREEGSNVELLDEELSSLMSYLNLPKSILELKELLEIKPDELRLDYSDSTQELDPRILSAALEIQDSSYVTEAQAVKRIKEEILSKLNNTQNLLLNEERNYSENKLRYGAKWTQQPSTMLNSSYKQNLTRTRKSLEDASLSDKKLESMISPYQYVLNFLSGGPHSSELRNAFNPSLPDNEVSLLDIDDGSFNTKAKIGQLDSKVQELHNLRKERANTYNDLKTAVRKDDISSIILINKDNPNMEENVFRKELLKFQPYRNRIEATGERQNLLMQEIKVLMSEVLNDPTIKKNRLSKHSQKETQSKQLNNYLDAYKQWKTYVTGLKQANSFYKQLFNLVNEQHNSVVNFTNQRQMEANALGQDSLSYGLGSLNLEGTSQPPPRPPKDSDQDPYKNPSVFDPLLYASFSDNNQSRR